MTGKEPPHHTGAGANASHTQPGANLFQRQIRFDGNQLKQPIFVGIKRREFAAHRLRCHRPDLSKARDPRIAELTLTSNAADASWQDAPASTARTTRSRKSRE
jgi:hypothetical protein